MLLVNEEIEIGNILTLISLFALPTERKLLFTCTKYRKIHYLVATKGECKRKSIYLYKVPKST